MAATRFAELLAQHVQDTVQRRFAYEKLDPATMRKIRQTIREIVSGVFQRSTHKLSDTGQSWLTNQVFKRLQVGPEAMMSDLIIINEHKLSELSLGEVRLLRDLFDETDMVSELDSELRARSTQ